MSIGAPLGHCEDVDAIKQRLLLIVGEDFNGSGKVGQEIPDREIVWRLADSGYGCPDIAGLQINGSVKNWNEFNEWMAEEEDFARNAGHILKVRTGYLVLPEFHLLVLDVERGKLKSPQLYRVRNIDRLGLREMSVLPVHEVETKELVEAIRAA